MELRTGAREEEKVLDIKNKDMLLFCVLQAYENFVDENRRPTNGKTAYFLLGTLLTWAVCCYERIKQTNGIPEDVKGRVRGLYFPNNCLKHNISVLNLHSLELGRTLPCRVGDPLAEYRWADLDYVDLPQFKDMGERDREFYNTYYRGKSIERTMENHINLIKQFMQNN